MSLLSLVSVCSCSANNRNQSETKDTQSTTENQIEEIKDMNTEGKKLVAYFSHAGENYNVGYIEEGNTHIIAQMISDAAGADIWEIAPLKPYPKDSYDECIKIAKDELRPMPVPQYKATLISKNMT